MNFKCYDRRRGGHPPLPGRRWIASAAAVLSVSAMSAPMALADGSARIVSINLCTDQLILALADPARIVGLSRFSRHAEMSYLAANAARYPALRGSAEEVLRLKPDLVVAGAYSGRATRAILSANGVRVETFAPPQTMAEARAEVERMARLLGRPAEGAALLGRIDETLAKAARATAGRSAITALAVQRRGFVSGRDTLLSAAMEAAGFTNGAQALGITSIDRAPLEVIVRLRPEVLVVEDLPRASDQATAILQHPVLARTGLRSRLLKLPVAEVTCGGPSLAPLIERLSAAAAAGR